MSGYTAEIIKNKTDILEIIGERVKLRRSGKNYVGLCPFHNEDTPSFFVFPDTQSYHCFGCNSGGNVFTFIMQTEGLDFRQTLELLASRAGIDLDFSKKKDLNSYDVLKIAAKFYSECLKNPEGSTARAYMKRRMLDENDYKNFSLGYSPSSWDALTRKLKNSGISERQILNAGLAIQNRNGGLYDRFRGRLMFPVKDITGKIIAFGGRLIDGEGAKYINSPETEVYTKRNNLYLLNDARKFIREKSRSILVEGYMDALRLHKCGFRETVASLGTSLTSEQAELLSKFSDRCYICYDSDTAGQEAALRGMYILQEHGLDVRVINIPEGKDPDEFLCSNGPEKFEELIKNARPLVLQHLNSLKYKLETPGLFRIGEKSLFEGLSKLKYPEIAPYTAQLCSALGLSPEELKKRLNGKNDNKKFNLNLTENKTANLKENERANFPASQAEAAVCALLWHYPELRINIKPEEIFKILGSSEISEISFAILTDGPEIMQERWLSVGETFPFSLISMGETFLKQLSESNKKIFDPFEAWEKLKNILKTFRANKRIEEIKFKLKHGTASQQELEELKNLF